MERGDGARVVGGVAGLLIGIVPAGVGLLVPDWDVLVPAGGLGAVTGAVLGYGLGPSVRHEDRVYAVLVTPYMAALAVGLGALIVGVLLAGAALASGSGLLAALGALVGYPLLGIAFFGLPAFALALACAIVWVVVMRTVPERSAAA